MILYVVLFRFIIIILYLFLTFDRMKAKCYWEGLYEYIGATYTGLYEIIVTHPSLFISEFYYTTIRNYLKWSPIKLRCYELFGKSKKNLLYGGVKLAKHTQCLVNLSLDI